MPVGVGIAVWLTEYGRPGRLARVVESTIEMIAGTPSIVLALFGTLIFSSTGARLPQPHARRASSSAARSSPPARCSRWSRCRWSSPATREGLQAIPHHVREASYAVGKTKAATTRRILLPTARPQVATGAMLGLGRIIGDTAIIVVLLGATQNFGPVGERFGPQVPARHRHAR